MAPKQWHQVKPNALTDYRELLDNAYIGGWDLKGRDGKFRDFTLTIASVEPYKPKRLRRGEQVTRFTVYFVEAEKPWLCGKTSGKTIKGIYGPPSKWPGKRITIYFDHDVMFGTTKTGGVRVRPTVPGGAPTELESQPVDPEMAGRIEEARKSLAEQLDEDDAAAGGNPIRSGPDDWGATGTGAPEPEPKGDV
jgi:hypothetical protein